MKLSYSGLGMQSFAFSCMPQPLRFPLDFARQESINLYAFLKSDLEKSVVDPNVIRLEFFQIQENQTSLSPLF